MRTLWSPAGPSEVHRERHQNNKPQTHRVRVRSHRDHKRFRVAVQRRRYGGHEFIAAQRGRCLRRRCRIVRPVPEALVGR